MKNYEIFHLATPEKMAVLLTSMVASVANVEDPLEIREIYDVYLELLNKETELAFLVETEEGETFAQKLKAARIAAGLSQQGLAIKTKIPTRALHSWETEERTPPVYLQRFVLDELRRLRKG